MSTETVLVQTKSGPVRGLFKSTVDQLSYISFQGIPYAQPPVGELRFKKPLPVKEWTTPLEAFYQPSFPPSLLPGTSDLDPMSNENCLFLNIFTRSTDTIDSSPRPVMIFIHGGGFMMGAASEDKYGADFFLRNDVVFVTIGYRLGALGFLSVADPAVECPGNAGLKDQSLGIRWVNDNIEAFGGDPQNITLFGGSAGAASVHMHMLSDYSKNLFHKAIVQSGSGLCSWGLQPKRDLSSELARSLGWNGEGGVHAMMNVLLTADVADITRCQWLRPEESSKGINIPFMFVPTVEPYGSEDSSNCFLPIQPEKMMSSAWGNGIPLIIGCNTDEGFIMQSFFKKIKTPFDDEAILASTTPSPVVSAMGDEERLNKAAAIRSFYYKSEEPSMDNVRNLVQMIGDALFWYPTFGAIQGRSSAVPTYLYRFCYDSLNPIFGSYKMSTCGELLRGTLHAEEMMYLFRKSHIDYESLLADSAEKKVTNNLINLWTSFAANGEPKAKTDGGHIIWEPVHLNDDPNSMPSLRCLSISDTIQMVNSPENDRMTFWSTIYQF